jgi:EmrB/QacA subfamily drug resistance transporter
VEHEQTDGIDPHVYEQRWVILGVLCLSLVLVVISVSSLNLALPTIQRSLDASGTELQWILDAYALVFAGFLLPAGALGDRFGRKGALQIGLLVFGLGALAGTLSTTPEMLIACRAGMGIGAALIMPATLSIIVNCFPMRERPKAVAVWAGFAGVGGALGPITSGFLLEHFWWGSVFLINLPVVALLLVLSAALVPTSKDPDGHPLDPIGALLSVIGLVALVFGVIEGPELGWTHWATLAGFAVAAVALSAFVGWELRMRYPTLDPRLFRNRAFASGSAAVTVAFFAMFGMFFLLTLYLQFVKGYSPLEAGVRVIPNALSLMLVAPRGPALVARFGVKRVVRAGFLLVAAGFTTLSFCTASTPYALIAVALVCCGTGMAIVMPPASQQIVGSLPLAKAGVGSAMNDVTREVGGALGIAVAGSIVASIYGTRAGFADVIPDEAAREAATESIGQAIAVADRGVEAGLVDARQYDAFVGAAREAFTDGTRVAFLTLAVLAVGASFLIARLMPDRLPTRTVPFTRSAGADAPLESTPGQAAGSRG